MSNPEEYPFKPSPLPPVGTANDKMMYIWMTDYVANSAAVVYQKAGLLSFNITDDMVCTSHYLCVHERGREREREREKEREREREREREEKRREREEII